MRLVTLWLLIPLGLVLTMRESGWLNFPLLERRCQTERAWAYRFGYVQAAAMWGFHIGCAFSTVITYSGLWLVTLAVFTSGNSIFGATIFIAYWLGRTLPLWIIAPFIRSAWNAETLYPVFRPIQVIGIALMLVTIVLILRAHASL
jgi:cytochrome c biogenesis protein CcdA